MKSRAPNLVGLKFGKLTVMCISSSKRGRSQWVCLCECGKTTVCAGTNLKNGVTKSCGCLKQENLIGNKRAKGQTHRRLPKGESGFTSIYCKYRWNALKRQIQFDDSDEYKSFFKTLTQQNCYYCGIKPNYIQKAHSKSLTTEGVENSKFIYNGVDRLDNTKGYTEDNSVSCCYQCNTMKLDYSFNEFKNKIIQLYNNLLTKVN